jgi:hypothetical protein
MVPTDDAMITRQTPDSASLLSRHETPFSQRIQMTITVSSKIGDITHSTPLEVPPFIYAVFVKVKIHEYQRSASGGADRESQTDYLTATLADL